MPSAPILNIKTDGGGENGVKAKTILVLGIVALFLGSAVMPSMSSLIKTKGVTTKSIQPQNQDLAEVTIYWYIPSGEIKEIKQKIPVSDAERLQRVINHSKDEILTIHSIVASDKVMEEAKENLGELINVLNELGFIPDDMTKTQALELLCYNYGLTRNSLIKEAKNVVNSAISKVKSTLVKSIAASIKNKVYGIWKKAGITDDMTLEEAMEKNSVSPTGWWNGKWVPALANVICGIFGGFYDAYGIVLGTHSIPLIPIGADLIWFVAGIYGWLATLGLLGATQVEDTKGITTLNLAIGYVGILITVLFPMVIRPIFYAVGICPLYLGVGGE